jgi:hypothetical protein
VILRAAAGLAAIIATAGTLYWLAPDERRYEMREALGLAGTEQEMACLDAVRHSALLQDPMSSQLISSYTLADGGVSIRYRTRNAFGAWETRHQACPGRDHTRYRYRVLNEHTDRLLSQ